MFQDLPYYCTKKVPKTHNQFFHFCHGVWNSLPGACSDLDVNRTSYTVNCKWNCIGICLLLIRVFSEWAQYYSITIFLATSSITMNLIITNGHLMILAINSSQDTCSSVVHPFYLSYHVLATTFRFFFFFYKYDTLLWPYQHNLVAPQGHHIHKCGTISCARIQIVLSMMDT